MHRKVGVDGRGPEPTGDVPHGEAACPRLAGRTPREIREHAFSSNESPICFFLPWALLHFGDLVEFRVSKVYGSLKVRESLTLLGMHECNLVSSAFSWQPGSTYA